MFDDTRDFLQAHFYCSPRTDTDFWKANKELALSDSLPSNYELLSSIHGRDYQKRDTADMNGR